MEHNNFKLCGGTLFALLTNAKLKRKREWYTDDLYLLNFPGLSSENKAVRLSREENHSH